MTCNAQKMRRERQIIKNKKNFLPLSKKIPLLLPQEEAVTVSAHFLQASQLREAREAVPSIYLFLQICQSLEL